MSAVLPGAAHGGALLPRGLSRQLSTAAVIAAATAAEAGLTVAVAHGAAPVAAALLAHGVVAVWLALWAWRLHAAGRGGRLVLLFAVATAGLGPVGPLGTLLAAALLQIFMRQATPFEDWYASLFPAAETHPTRALYERIVLRGGGPGAHGSVAPFADVMAAGTVEQKQAVVTLIADNFRPTFAAALRGALNDAEPAIRVQAATAAARIENRFLERSLALEGRRASEPDHAGVLLELARHHDDYAHTGLLDASRADSARRRALAHYEQCDRLHPDDPAVAKTIARLLVRIGRCDDAVERIEPLVEQGTAAPELLAWYGEGLYRLQRFEALRAACRCFGCPPAGTDGLPDEVRQVLAWWADDGRLQEQSE